jgi:hypothetical protein
MCIPSIIARQRLGKNRYRGKECTRKNRRTITVLVVSKEISRLVFPATSCYRSAVFKAVKMHVVVSWSSGVKMETVGSTETKRSRHLPDYTAPHLRSLDLDTQGTLVCTGWRSCFLFERSQHKEWLSNMERKLINNPRICSEGSSKITETYQLAFGPRLEPEMSTTRSRSATHSTATFSVLWFRR